MAGPTAYHVESMFAMFGDSDSVVTVTLTYTDGSGEEYGTDSAPTVYYAEFFTNNGQYPWMMEAKFIDIDAFMNITTDASVAKGGKVTVDSKEYIIDAVTRKKNGTANLYDFCSLIYND